MRRCTDCPTEIPPHPGKGRPATRCPACAHRRHVERTKAQRAARRPTELPTCARDGCTRRVTKPARGRTPSYCDDHRDTSRATSRVLARRVNGSVRKEILPGAVFVPVTPAEIEHLHRSTCSYCQERPATEFDHVMPLSLGGDHTPGNRVPCCQTCNVSKGNRLLIVWRTSPTLLCPDRLRLSPTDH